MVPPLGRRDAGLIDRLVERPAAFEFFQAVRILEIWSRERADEERVRRAPDVAGAPQNVRFVGAPQLRFPAGAATRVRLDASTARDEAASASEGAPAEAPGAEVRSAFLGMIGPVGVLPHHYTEDLVRRLSLRDETLRDFLDIFHQRALTLFYRAWQKYRLAITWERAQAEGGRDDADLVLRSLVGLGTDGLRGRRSFDDRAYISFFGHFAARPRPAVGLQCVMEGYLKVPVRLESFVGRWLSIESEQQTRLASRAQPDGQHAQLGRGAVLGARTWDVSSQVRLHVGPLSFERFSELLPGTAQHRRAAELAQAYLGPEIDCDLELLLAGDEKPPLQLGGPHPERSVLGRTAFLDAEHSAAVDARVPVALTSTLSSSYPN